MEETKRNPPAAVTDYYSRKLAEHGDTPKGADWNGEERQLRCFAELVKVIDGSSAYSINDLGCGYGALYSYLNGRGDQFQYNGFDVTPGMIEAARTRHAGSANSRFSVASEPDAIADFGIACGIFSVRLDSPDNVWKEYMAASLDVLDRTSRRGFAFNALTIYSDADRMQDYLFYADPCEWFDWCKRRYAKNVALLHDYGLYEFTIIVRKDR